MGWVPGRQLELELEGAKDKHHTGVLVKDNKVLHSFYSKPVSSKYTILKRTALSDTVKKHTIFQKCIRRLSNISIDLPWQICVKHLNDISKKLQRSGYSQQERYNSIKGSITRHCQMVANVRSGILRSELIFREAELFNSSSR